MKVIVIGSGFAGLVAGASMAQAGFDVIILEKNHSIGGRARQFEAEGFKFDMGPSWYWMPDVFEDFYQKFNHTSSDFYELIRLNPSYHVIWQDEIVKIPAGTDELKQLFEEYQKGSAKHLESFLSDAELKYQVGMKDFVRKPALSVLEFLDFNLLKKAVGINLFQPISKTIRKKFQHPKLIQLLEFPVLFLGAEAKNTPALYSLMNYADMVLGTWYPKGGMYETVKAFQKIAQEQGVKIMNNQEVESVSISEKSIKSVHTKTDQFECDILVNTADYHHFDQEILPKSYRHYSSAYWETRKLAPSCFLYYIGLNRKLPESISHHNLFFDTNFQLHSQSIYESHSLPEEPLFYLCCPSKTDIDAAPENCENVFILIPVSTETDDSQEIRDQYFEKVMKRILKTSGVDIREHLVFKRDFAKTDFQRHYHSFRGNAYGLANTLLQTAFLKPKMRHKKIQNLFHAGQLTSPGPGVPPSIISGEVVAELIRNEFEL